MNKWIPLCCILSVEWVIIMDVLKVKFNDISLYTKKKTILSEDRLSAYITTTFHMFFDIFFNLINFTIGIAVG